MCVSAFNNRDDELWLSFLDGDKQSYATVYERYFPQLYEYGLRLAKDKGLVKDCIQDMFVKLWVNRRNLSSVKAVKPYLFTAFRHTVLNKLDQAHRMARREASSMQSGFFEIHYSIENSIILSDEQHEKEKRILKALNNLTSHQKEAVFLRFYVGMEYKEIAEMMQISVKSTYKVIGRAISVMRKYFKEMSLYCIITLFLLV